jgi:multisubunit Na+/H+ antiporter MnhC subunit
MFSPQPNRPLRQTLFLATIVIGFTMLGAVILYAVTEWLWLVVHQGLH